MVPSLSTELDYTYGTVEVFGDELPLSAIKQHHIREIRKWKEQGNVVVNEAYFSGEYPSVYYKKVSDFQVPHIKAILDTHKKIWNQGKVTFLVVESPVEFRVVNCSEKPFSSFQQNKNIDDLTLLNGRRDDAEAMRELKQVFGKISIETGLFWQEKKYARKVKMGKRVEQALIENLKAARLELKKELPSPLIHNLLLRSLFVLYLEDRGATDAAFYNKYLPGAKTYFDVLENHEATYSLFEKLDESFNGNLSPVTKEEKKAVNEGHLLRIKECFWSKIEQQGQLKLFDWRMFDFSVIPIQLISEIYEDFLRDEKGEAEQSAKGAFYTPHPLAEFIMNEVLPYPSGGNTRHDLKILDPTCGSGIFLVESLNRLLDRWEAAHKDKKLTFEAIEKIACDNIFGIEIQKEAIKVAAFSLYLSMLDRLDPKSLWQIRKFPYLIFDPEEENEEKRGYNLFRMDSMKSGPFEEIKFDLVVGNPPFGTKNLEENVKEYLQSRGFATEMVLAFLHRATVLCPEGKIALIATSKILLNNLGTYQTFRKFLFNDTYVEKVYNFSILRKASMEDGKKYIPNASVPISILFYSKTPPSQPSKKIIYCAPKTAIKNQLIDGIVTDVTDIKYLPREECQKPNSKIWKAAMWGTERDFQFLTDLANKYPTLLDSLSDWKSDMGVGFEKIPPRERDSEIKLMKHLPSNILEKYYTPEEDSNDIELNEFRTIGNKNAYKAPHLLIKEGIKDGNLVASYIDYPCSFTKSIFGIHLSSDHLLKVLTGYLNSDIFKYLLFLTSVDWGIERNRVMPNEFLDLPNLCFGLSKDAEIDIQSFIDEIIQIKKEELFGVDQQIENLKANIEKAFLAPLKLTDTEKVLIEDLLHFSLGAFQGKKQSDAYYPCTTSDTKQYARYLCRTINQFLENTPTLSAWASVFDLTHRSPLNIVALRLNRSETPGKIEILPGAVMQPILKDIEAYTYRKHSESIYYRKFIRYYSSDTIYIVKPNEKRCWSRSMGLNDADEIVAEILKSSNGR